jgi:hypothetical protein
MKKSKHIHVQGMWFKSLDLKTRSSEKLAIMELSENFLCPQNGPEKPQSNFCKLQLWDAAVSDDQSSQREQDECVFHLATVRRVSLAVGGSVKTTEVPEVLRSRGWKKGTEHIICLNQ